LLDSLLQELAAAGNNKNDEASTGYGFPTTKVDKIFTS